MSEIFRRWSSEASDQGALGSPGTEVGKIWYVPALKYRLIPAVARHNCQILARWGNHMNRSLKLSSSLMLWKSCKMAMEKHSSQHKLILNRHKQGAQSRVLPHSYKGEACNSTENANTKPTRSCRTEMKWGCQIKEHPLVLAHQTIRRKREFEKSRRDMV